MFKTIPHLLVGGAVSTSMLLSTTTARPVNALDIDSFMQKEIENETCNEKTDKKCKPKLSDDEALCRFGQPSRETGEACIRSGISTSRKGGVDAFGAVDRGTFTRCKAKYIDDGKSDKLVKTWVCQDTPL